MTAAWNKILRARTQDWTFVPFRPEQTPNGLENRKIEPNTSYLSAFLHSMRIVNVRKGLAKFFGTVHSSISLLCEGKWLAEFQARRDSIVENSRSMA